MDDFPHERQQFYSPDFIPHFWNHLSIVLHPTRNPEYEARAKADEEREDPSQSSWYLEQRDRGFVFISWFNKPTGRIPWKTQKDKGKPGGSVGLFVTVDHPHELVVIKRILGHTERTLNYSLNRFTHPEAAFNTVRDEVMQKVTLPSFPSSLPQTYAFQVHGDGPDKNRRRAEATIFQKYYNGGNLKELVLQHKRLKRQIPEPFIWHVISELGRAYSVLHLGEANRRYTVAEYNANHNNQAHAMNNRGMGTNWSEEDAIIHSNGRLENIFLHWPDDAAERDHATDGSYRKYRSEGCPMVVLGDFGLAFQARKAMELTRDDVLSHISHPTMPERTTWRDKAHLGHIVKHLLLAHHPDTDICENMYQDFRQVAARGEIQLVGHLDALGLTALYSPRLLEVAVNLERLGNLLTRSANGTEDFWTNLRNTAANDWDNWIRNNTLYGSTIAEADYVLDSNLWGTGRFALPDQYRLPKDLPNRDTLFSNGLYDLKWATPKETLIPVRSRARYPPDTRRDWRAVWRYLEKRIDHEFSDYRYRDHAPYEERPVEIMKVWPKRGMEEESPSKYDPPMEAVDPDPNDWNEPRRKRRERDEEKGRRRRNEVARSAIMLLRIVKTKQK
ncbi:hypothetical protein QBC38DRAFT_484952 [Podospora fimiseda]|uniref:Uncharacterized protein n=1 Tax=Podospora fimiseda TaxID=252190 RepID=A0AAN7BK28_9PEZI|nr:hypothetical protein QBC38DRAFT_484952 [Podospora fimiseda]